MRLDQYLVKIDAVRSRHRAQIEIKAGRILVNQAVVLKPSYPVKGDDEVRVLEPFNPYVSQGGLKLAHAIEVFALDLKDKIIFDIGASTGGFTDCALKHGALKVYAIDVGHNQLDETLTQHPQVISLEETNYLTLHLASLDIPDFCLMDVSFTSGIPFVLHSFNHFDRPFIWLIKPQFETMKTPKSGVIKDAKLHKEVLAHLQKTLNHHQLYFQAITPSPIKGQKGNREFLSLIGKTKHYLQIDAIIDDVKSE